MSIVTCGIDIGSRTIKALLFDEKTGKIRHYIISDSTSNPRNASQEIFNRLLLESNVKRKDLQAIVATGYSREQFVDADRRITEISCHAMGVFYLFPRARTIIDIGGQDSKIIRLQKNGSVEDFAMNDRCAAGTGRFLEVVEKILEVRLDDMEKLALQSTDPSEISSMCVVFAESEIISLLAQGKERSDILAGVTKSLAHRIYSLSSKTGIIEPVIFTGGVARNGAVVKALEKVFNFKLSIPDNPFITGALGAAILALKPEKH